MRSTLGVIVTCLVAASCFPVNEEISVGNSSHSLEQSETLESRRKTTLSDDLTKFRRLLPDAKIKKLVTKYCDNDEEYRDFVKYLKYGQGRTIFREIKTVDEVKELVDFLENNGEDIDGVMDRIGVLYEGCAVTLTEPEDSSNAFLNTKVPDVEPCLQYSDSKTTESPSAVSRPQPCQPCPPCPSCPSCPSEDESSITYLDLKSTEAPVPPSHSSPAQPCSPEIDSPITYLDSKSTEAPPKIISSTHPPVPPFPSEHDSPITCHDSKTTEAPVSPSHGSPEQPSSPENGPSITYLDLEITEAPPKVVSSTHSPVQPYPSEHDPSMAFPDSSTTESKPEVTPSTSSSARPHPPNDSSITFLDSAVSAEAPSSSAEPTASSTVKPTVVPCSTVPVVQCSGSPRPVINISVSGTSGAGCDLSADVVVNVSVNLNKTVSNCKNGFDPRTSEHGIVSQDDSKFGSSESNRERSGSPRRLVKTGGLKGFFNEVKKMMPKVRLNFLYRMKSRNSPKFSEYIKFWDRNLKEFRQSLTENPVIKRLKDYLEKRNVNIDDASVYLRVYFGFPM